MRLMFLIVHFLIFQSFAKAKSCEPGLPPKTYLQARKKLDEKILDFSKSKVISGLADETLGRLVKAKSPVILQWMNKRDLGSKTDEEVAREWRLYYAREFILTQYPHSKSPEVNTAIENLMKDALHIFNQTGQKKKIEALFKKAQKQSLNTLDHFPLSADQKNQGKSRIKAIQLYWMKDFKDSKYASLPLDFLEWGIAYDPNANEINIGLEALAYPYEETYLAVFAHEMGHAIDSCRWGDFLKGPWPFDKIGECLRSERSVGAKKRDDSKIDDLEKSNPEVAANMKANPTCNKLGYPTGDLQSDQLPESFADWFSAEVMATFDHIKLDSLRSDLCKSQDLRAGSSYPANQKRLDAIYFAQPKLRSGQTPTQSESTYCEFNKTTE